MALAMAPNSVGAERVFSLLKILFGSNQGTTHSDYIRGSIMLRNNNNTERSYEALKKSLAEPVMLKRGRNKYTKNGRKISGKYTKNIRKMSEKKGREKRRDEAP
jgi:hypothetical protein